MCGCPLSCPGARTLGPAWRLVATALLLATPATCLGRNRSVSSPSFGSHKTANPRTLSCATRRRERCPLFGGCLLHGVCCHERRGPRPPPTNRRRAACLPHRSTPGAAHKTPPSKRQARCSERKADTYPNARVRDARNNLRARRATAPPWQYSSAPPGSSATR